MYEIQVAKHFVYDKTTMKRCQICVMPNQVKTYPRYLAYYIINVYFYEHLSFSSSKSYFFWALTCQQP